MNYLDIRQRQIGESKTLDLRVSKNTTPKLNGTENYKPKFLFFKNVAYSFAVASFSVIAIFLILNFTIIQKQFENKEVSAQNFEEKSVVLEKEKERIEIPSIGVIGKLEYPKEESEIEKTINNSIAHFPQTANPWERGNAAFTAHSSSIGGGEYNNIFSSLNKLESGDEITIFHNNAPIKYIVSSKKIISATDFSVLENNQNDLALVSCWPLGTDLKRYVVYAEKSEE